MKPLTRCRYLVVLLKSCTKKYGISPLRSLPKDLHTEPNNIYLKMRPSDSLALENDAHRPNDL